MAELKLLQLLQLVSQERKRLKFTGIPTDLSNSVPYIIVSLDWEITVEQKNQCVTIGKYKKNS
jgi:hypothetical protein